MVPKYSLQFRKTHNPVTEFSTKFGGQPVWLSEPAWPVSRATGKAMLFVGQFLLYPEVFGDVLGQIAYVFVTDDQEGGLRTWEPDGGENAVVIQPGTYEGRSVCSRTGPDLGLTASSFFSLRFKCRPIEYVADLTLGADPEPVADDEFWAWEEDRRQEYYQSLLGHKIGGSPAWVHHSEHLGDGQWRLGLQIDSNNPLYLDLGDAGVAYAFISHDGSRGKFLWQGH